MNKEELLNKLYKDTKLAINSIDRLYKEARKEDNTITYKEVKEWYNKQSINQRKNYARYNSFVANLPRQQFQLDWAYMTFLDDENLGRYKYAFLCIDVFSKYVDVIPSNKITSKDSSEALQTCFDKMGTPIYVVSDKGPEFTGKEMRELMENDFVEHIFTLKHAYLLKDVF